MGVVHLFIFSKKALIPLRSGGYAKNELHPKNSFPLTTEYPTTILLPYGVRVREGILT